MLSILFNMVPPSIGDFALASPAGSLRSREREIARQTTGQPPEPSPHMVWHAPNSGPGATVALQLSWHDCSSPL
jgi:hypothetical protein